MMKLLGMPPQATVESGSVDSLILWVHYLMGALFVGWLAYFLYAIFRFRASKSPKASYTGVQSHFSSWLEGFVAVLELALLVGLSIPLWAKLADKFPDRKQATEIRVIAEQFAWHGLYPGPDGTFGKADFHLVSATNQYGRDYTDPATKDDFEGNLNEIMVPVNKPVIAHISSKDVIHSFKVNPLRITQDAIPGLSIPIWFTPNREGQYLINCAQLCGNSHYFMKGFFNVLSPEKFQAWYIEKSRAAASSAGGFE
jgi:cytochrome c oxidase subunit 2